MDRLGRSLRDLVAFLDELHAKGVDLYPHRQRLDTSTPSGKMLFQMLSVFSAFEAALIRERVRSGIARARSQGKRLGRPRLSAGRERRIRDLLAAGIGIIKTARIVGCGVSAGQRIKAEPA